MQTKLNFTGVKQLEIFATQVNPDGTETNIDDNKEDIQILAESDCFKCNRSCGDKCRHGILPDISWKTFKR